MSSGGTTLKAVMLVYADDLVIVERTPSTIHDILNQLSSKWTLSSLGPATYVLGMRVTRDHPNKTIALSQAVINTLLKRFPGSSVTYSGSLIVPVPTSHLPPLSLLAILPRPRSPLLPISHSTPRHHARGDGIYQDPYMLWQVVRIRGDPHLDTPPTFAAPLSVGAHVDNAPQILQLWEPNILPHQKQLVR